MLRERSLRRKCVAEANRQRPESLPREWNDGIARSLHGITLPQTSLSDSGKVHPVSRYEIVQPCSRSKVTTPTGPNASSLA